METKISILNEFLHSLWPAAKKRRGKPHDYNWPSMVLFFMVMILKGIHSYQAMARYVKEHYRCFGWQKGPSGKTIARRFEALPQVIYLLMPLVAKAASGLDTQVCSFRWVFIDKSVFRAKGGLWHRVHRLLGVVPHSSIDTDASWARSAYHGLRMEHIRSTGYGLHLVCNEHRFPLACWVTTAERKDTTQLVPLLVHFVEQVGVGMAMCIRSVADAGYRAIALIKQLLKCWQVFVLLPGCFKGAHLTDWQKHYNRLAQTPQARWLYKQIRLNSGFKWKS